MIMAQFLLSMNAFKILLFSVFLSQTLCLSSSDESLENDSSVKSKIVLKSGSEVFDLWKSVSSPAYQSVYVWNVTNPYDILNSGSKPILHELGPYVFRVDRHKENITFQSNGTLSYRVRNVYHFVSEKSGNVSLQDMIVHLNIIPVAASSIVHNQYGDNEFMYYSIETACNISDCSLFIKHNVSDLLFEGYNDVMIEEASNIFRMPFKKLGYFYSRNNTYSDGTFNIYTGQTDSNKLGLIDLWNYNRKLGFYSPNSGCDNFEHSSIGGIQPSTILKDTSNPIHVFDPKLARSFRLDFQNKSQFNGINYNRYAADHQIFNYDREENRCFCQIQSNKVVCPENGVANISASSFGIPIFISFPHFLYANEVYTKNLVGMKPNQNKHGFNIDIEPTLGLTLRNDMNMQVNVLVERNDKFSPMSKFPFNRLLLPQMWTKITYESDNAFIEKIKKSTQALKQSQSERKPETHKE